MFCTNCGTDVSNVKFCANCGTEAVNATGTPTGKTPATETPAPAPTARITPITSNPDSPNSPIGTGFSGVTFSQAVRLGFRNYANFTGRSSRSEYWYWALFTALVTAVPMLIIAITAASTPEDDAPSAPGGIAVVLSVLVLLVAVFGLIVPNIAVTVRRLHDSDKSGWFYLFTFIPYAGGIIVLVFTLLASTPGENRFGPVLRTHP